MKCRVKVKLLCSCCYHDILVKNLLTLMWNVVFEVGLV